jgi:hypothetical protein
VDKPNLSQAKQVSQGGEPTGIQGQPVWAPRLPLPPAKIGKSKAEVLSGPILNSYITRAAPNDLPNLAKSNFNIYMARQNHVGGKVTSMRGA